MQLIILKVIVAFISLRFLIYCESHNIFYVSLKSTYFYKKFSVCLGTSSLVRFLRPSNSSKSLT